MATDEEISNLEWHVVEASIARRLAEKAMFPISQTPALSFPHDSTEGSILLKAFTHEQKTVDALIAAREKGGSERSERNNGASTEADVKTALAVAGAYGQDDGAHHKAWVIDQMVRLLTGPSYDNWIAAYRAGEDGPETYSWDEGIPP